MNERIVAISEIQEGKSWSSMEGFAVETTEQTIKLLIDAGQSCCERYGYFFCNDDPQQFVGAEVRGIRITDKALSEAVMKSNDLDPSEKYFEGGVMFVDIETDRGTLQFVAYNEHNGYYGHEAKVVSKQLTHEETL